ncbi:tyrosine-protein kinase [Streptococcus caprae]|uniref:Tyrosine-protein kinase CpsD n=1 Tax=Streptococcus caprae TaxID=1640501 RepID=A0ABV8CTP2_9STRE
MVQLELVRTRTEEIKKAEEYLNSIRTNIQFSGSSIKTIVLTSVQPGEGKSTTSISLSASFAHTGYRTLLIDADTRNSVMSGSFKATGKVKGLTAFLSGNAELSEVICDTNVENLMVIPSGQVPPNPTNLLQNQNFLTLINTVKDLFDYVIIDSPPIGLVIDAAIIAQNCDASIIVTEAGTIKSRFLQRAHEQMEQAGAQFLGVILNKFDATLDAYGSYGAYGGYGQYGEYGKKKSKNKKKKK